MSMWGRISTTFLIILPARTASGQLSRTRHRGNQVRVQLLCTGFALFQFLKGAGSSFVLHRPWEHVKRGCLKGHACCGRGCAPTTFSTLQP